MTRGKHKIDKQEIAWWTYLAIMVALIVYGFWDSTAAELLLRAIKDAYTLFNGIIIWNNSRNL